MTVFTQHCMADDAAAKSFTDYALHHLALLTGFDLSLTVERLAFSARHIWRDLKGYLSMCRAMLKRVVVGFAVICVQLEVLHWLLGNVFPV